MHWGPQTYEAYLSDVCELFTCPPDVAERQDAARVQAIMEYRAARQAIDLFNEGRKAMGRLEKAPGLLNLLVEMHRAQVGAPVTADALLAEMGARGGDDGS